MSNVAAYGARAARVMQDTSRTSQELFDSTSLTKMDKLLTLLAAQQSTIAAHTALLMALVEEVTKLRLVAEQAYAPRSDRGSGGSTPSGATKTDDELAQGHAVGCSCAACHRLSS